MSACDCKPKGIIDSLLGSVDSILGIRDSIGAVLKPVYLVTRTWSGAEPGAGTATDVSVQILPSPQIVDLSQNINLKEGGALKAGDIILKNISKNFYNEFDLDATSPANNIEKLYLVGDKLYQVVNVKEQYLTWSVQLRELSNQTRY